MNSNKIFKKLINKQSFFNASKTFIYLMIGIIFLIILNLLVYHFVLPINIVKKKLNIKIENGLDKLLNTFLIVISIVLISIIILLIIFIILFLLNQMKTKIKSKNRLRKFPLSSEEINLLNISSLIDYIFLLNNAVVYETIYGYFEYSINNEIKEKIIKNIKENFEIEENCEIKIYFKNNSNFAPINVTNDSLIYINPYFDTEYDWKLKTDTNYCIDYKRKKNE